jgi:hypothetical protein
VRVVEHHKTAHIHHLNRLCRATATHKRVGGNSHVRDPERTAQQRSARDTDDEREASTVVEFNARVLKDGIA